MTSASHKKISLIPLVLALIIMGITGWYGYRQYTQLTDVNDKLATADVSLLEIEQKKSTVSKAYQNEKKAYVSQVTANQERLVQILPLAEDLTGLTRLFDDFAFKHHFKNNPFFISNLSYSPATEVESAAYSVIPINMTLETSEQNLRKFLEFVKNSGSLSNGVRLLSVNGLTMELTDGPAAARRVQLALHAYLQN